ncbi:MAG: aminotransferase class I/II-fold pyridoxal phosphate-dependent enzyme [Thaumarchaeota archaeon]|nr:aminotransferase class I/II-fold pyridoxal phosphate-dependent enzyme [Nitrososphaerota archaeon]
MKPKFNFINARLGRIRSNLYRSLHDARVLGPYVIIKRKKLVNLSSNDYLGLGYTKIFPMQTQSSSRLISGNDNLFKKLETRLARHKRQESALVFPTGYMANLGAISILPQKDDVILSDELNHASIIDSCRLTHARKAIYKHNNMQDLEKRLQKDRRRKFVVTEGIFSMNGDFSRLQEITELCKKHDAILILDDAHGDFVAGSDGRGSAEYLGVSKKIDVYISSLSKGLGAFGGYVASKKEVIDLAINTSRPFIYTSALPNFLVQVALDKISSNREQKRVKLWKNTNMMRKGLESCGYQIESQSQIIPVIIGNEKKTLEFGRYLSSNGVFAQPIRYPTVQLGSARIRISVTSWLTDESIAKSLDVFERAGKKFGII